MLSRIKRLGTSLSFLSTIGLALAPACGTRESQDAVITIDPTTRYQTMVAWEATAQAGQEFKSFPEYRDMLFSNAVNQLGINRLRVELRSGAENGAAPQSQMYETVNDNDDPLVINENGFHFGELDSMIEQVVLPMKKLLDESGESLLINLNYVDFGPSSFEHKEHPDEYAEFILAAFLHLKAKYGFVPDTVELILEPDTDSADWSAKQVATAAVATAARLKANGFAPAFVAPSTTNAANAVKYIDEIAQVPGALETVVEFSYHRYADATEDVLKDIASRGRLYGKRTSMLEWIGADQTTLYQDLTLANVSAWQQYTLAFSGRDDGGAYYKVKSEESGSEIAIGKRTRHLRQYFQCARAGAVRVAASSSNPNLAPVAFQDSRGSFSLTINAEAPGTAKIRGLSPQVYTISLTTDEADVRLPDAGLSGDGEMTVKIPSAGVLSICAK